MRALPLSPGSTALDGIRSIHLVGRTGARTVRVLEVSGFAAGWALKLEGVTTREAAEALRGARIELDRSALPLAPGEFFVSDLIGCAAFDLAGMPLGEVVELMPLPAYDIVVVRAGAAERMIPLVPAFLVSVDVAARRVVFDPPEEED